MHCLIGAIDVKEDVKDVNNFINKKSVEEVKVISKINYSKVHPILHSSYKF